MVDDALARVVRVLQAEFNGEREALRELPGEIGAEAVKFIRRLERLPRHGAQIVARGVVDIGSGSLADDRIPFVLAAPIDFEAEAGRAGRDRADVYVAGIRDIGVREVRAHEQRGRAVEELDFRAGVEGEVAECFVNSGPEFVMPTDAACGSMTECS